MLALVFERRRAGDDFPDDLDVFAGARERLRKAAYSEVLRLIRAHCAFHLTYGGVLRIDLL